MNVDSNGLAVVVQLLTQILFKSIVAIGITKAKPFSIQVKPNKYEICTLSDELTPLRAEISACWKKALTWPIITLKFPEKLEKPKA